MPAVPCLISSIEIVWSVPAKSWSGVSLLVLVWCVVFF
jgi:hypothetical protein